MPKPRSKKVATIQLKPRIINRPMRESTCKKEQAFIVKNRPFLETNRLLNSNTHHYNDDLAESNSIWLKAKGDEFYKRKDCSSAVNPCMRAFEQSSTNLINITDGRGMWRCHSCFALIELPSSRRDLKSLRRKIFDGRSPWRLFDLSAIAVAFYTVPCTDWGCRW
jgi:hypothetical protein